MNKTVINHHILESNQTMAELNRQMDELKKAP